MIRILTIIGTRPEVIKMAPIIGALKADPGFDSRVCVTGQHRQMVDQCLTLFSIRPDFDLDIMKPAQRLTDVASRTMKGLAGILTDYRPDYVLVEGDTTTALAAAVAAFYHCVKVGHVEAGLRTNDLYSPWPEEANRRAIGVFAHLHFAPTRAARENLLREGIPDRRVFVTGNTVIDAILSVSASIDQSPNLCKRCAEMLPTNVDFKKRVILVTGHRRESFGPGLERILRSLAAVVRRRDVQILYPVHLNPNVLEPAKEILGDVPNVFLTSPLDYLTFVYAMKNCFCIVTDSGGIQEEAPVLGKPLLVTRDNTERPEAVLAGTAVLVGTDPDKLSSWIDRLLDDPEVLASMSRKHNALGDGRAAQHILDVIRNAAD